MAGSRPRSGALAALAVLLVTASVPVAPTAGAAAAQVATGEARTRAVPPAFGCHTSDDGSYTTCFNNPGTGAPPGDARVVDYLTSLVRSTGQDPDDRIRIALFQWRHVSTDGFRSRAVEEFTSAVIAAHRRGVDVKLVLDDKINGMEPYTALIDAGMADRITVCDTRCIDEIEPHERDTGVPAPSINHNKLFLFRIGDHKNLVLTSHNFTAGAQTRYQNLIHIRDDVRLYDFFYGYWRRLKERSWEVNGTRWSQSWQRERTGDRDTNDTKGFVFPRPWPEDVVVDILEGISACPDAYNRKVWIAASHFSKARGTTNGAALKDRLVQLHEMGCSVKIVLDGHLPEGWLQDGPLRNSWVRYLPNLHDKFLVIDAVYQGKRQEFVLTGSHNLSWTSAWRDDEAMVQVEDTHVFRAYRENFEVLFDRSLD